MNATPESDSTFDTLEALARGRTDLYAQALGHRTDDRPSRFVYIVPCDVESRPEAVSVIRNAALHLQRWIWEALERKRTFPVARSIVDVVHSEQTAAWFREAPNGENRSQWFWLNVVSEMNRLGYGGFYDPNHRWIYYIEAENDRDQSVGGAGGVALLPKHDVDGLLGLSSESRCRWVGGLGHEWGHATGLPHPPGCDTGSCTQGPLAYRSLMFLGYLEYPNTHLLEEDIARLMDSPFLSVSALSGQPFNCTEIGTHTAAI